MKAQASGPREPREERRSTAAPAPKQMQSKPQAPSQGAFGAALAEAMKKK
jgi:hypothetical protein